MLVTHSQNLLFYSPRYVMISFPIQQETHVSGGFSQNIHPKSGTGSANLALLLGRFPEDTIEEIGRVVLAPIKKQTQGPRDPVS